ncbi:histidine kinase [Amycolatopsis antarctica]|uniref:histidine kinase n=1 Tax=Amycolatopsis antarctica TaxID=1854586 RepID=A0A263D579_9PSEU|nr:sensor histidine kinase [Amycolatopsis antarctica]OZM73583.1 histidine kinase [Amycolatopsis antarctica]
MGLHSAWSTVRSRLLVSAPYLLIGGGTAVLSLISLYLVAILAVLSVLGIGLPLVPGAVTLLRRYTSFERTRASEVLGAHISEAHRPLRGALLLRVHTAITDASTGRGVLWLLLHGIVGLLTSAAALTLVVGSVTWLTAPFVWAITAEPVNVTFGSVGSWTSAVLAVPVGVAYAVLALVVPPYLARFHARMARAVLAAPRRKLAERVVELATSRAGALEAHDAELRRIERDLHDGTQAQMVAVSLRLGLATRAYAGGEPSEQTMKLITEARELSEQALVSLRHVVRNLHPPALTDRGLAGAARALVAACTVPTTLDIHGPADGQRPPAAVEAAAYFVIGEALTNVVKHSEADNAQVRLDVSGRSVRIRVEDDGRGGADERGGSGIAGIRRRIAAFDGTSEIVSPTGGPTIVRVEIPCGS